MPGVSTNTIWVSPAIATPFTVMRVVCTLGLTMATFDPTRALVSVDLPALGAPMMAQKPQRVVMACTRASSFAAASCSASRLEPPSPVCGASPSTTASIMKCGAWAGPVRASFAIGGRGQAAALRPFLQPGLGVAHFRALARIVEHLGPIALDEVSRRRHAAIEIKRGDHRFADIAEDRRPGAGRCRSRRPPA